MLLSCFSFVPGQARNTRDSDRSAHPLLLLWTNTCLVGEPKAIYRFCLMQYSNNQQGEPSIYSWHQSLSSQMELMKDGGSHTLGTLPYLAPFDWFPFSMPEDMEKAHKQVSIKFGRKSHSEPVTLCILAESWSWEFWQLAVKLMVRHRLHSKSLGYIVGSVNQIIIKLVPLDVGQWRG